MPNRSHTALHIIASLALVLWAGSTWVSGYVFAPILFAAYERTQAGEIAGLLFKAVNIIGLVSAMLLLLDYRVRFSKQLQHQRGLWLVALILFLVLLQYVGFAPLMQKAKLAGDVGQFAQWHGVSQVVYLLQSLGLVALLYERLYKNQAAPSAT